VQFQQAWDALLTKLEEMGYRPPPGRVDEEAGEDEEASSMPPWVPRKPETREICEKVYEIWLELDSVTLGHFAPNYMDSFS
jgi:hypothetical protein